MHSIHTCAGILVHCPIQGRSVASSRPLRPAKRKRVEDGSGGNANTSTDNHTKASQIGTYMCLGEEIS